MATYGEITYRQNPTYELFPLSAHWEKHCHLQIQFITIIQILQSEVELDLKNFKPFGSPVYVLEASLQSKKSHNKWYDKSKVGILLCHSRSVPPGPQHAKRERQPPISRLFYPDFDTCKPYIKLHYIWKHKAKLHTDRKPNPSEPSPTQPHTATIRNFELAIDIPDHLSQPWDTTVPTPKPSVNSLPCQQPLAGGLKSLSPTNTSAHSTKNAPVQYIKNATIPLLTSVVN